MLCIYWLLLNLSAALTFWTPGPYPACYSLNPNWLTKEHFKLRMCSTKLCISVSGSPGLKTWPHPWFFSFSHTPTSNPSENPLGQQFPAPDSLAVSKTLSEVLGGQNYLPNNTKTFCLVHSYLYMSAPWSFPLLHYDMQMASWLWWLMKCILYIHRF